MSDYFDDPGDAELVAGFLKLNSSGFAQHITHNSCLELREACQVAVVIIDTIQVAADEAASEED